MNALLSARSAVFAIPIVWICLGCGSWDNASFEATGSVSAGVVVGSVDYVTVDQDGANIPSRYVPILDAIGFLEPSDCTVGHVGGGLVIAAGHCLAFLDGPCSDYTVRWGYRLGRDGMNSVCTRILTRERTDDRDYAVFEVSPAPTAALAVERCVEPEYGTALTMFGHPSRQPLAWSNICMLEPASMGARGKDEFAHACDSQDGSSGAPMFADGTLRVVGIHNGGRGLWNYGTFLSAVDFGSENAVTCTCSGARGR